MIDYRPGNLHFSLLIIILAVSFFISSSAQITDFTAKEEQAHSAFMNERFEQALNHYNELKDIFQQNPEYHYYIGRCLMEMNENTIETTDNLRFAAIRGERQDAWFFLGRVYHLGADYEKAVYAYKRYMKLGKKSDIKRLRVKEALILAENRGNLSTVKSQVSPEKIDVAAEESGNHQSYENHRAPSAAESKKGNNSKAEDKDVNAMYNDDDLTKALNLQLVADSLNRTAKMKRSDLKETEVTEERSRLIAEISHLEKDSHKIQKEADKLFEGMQKDTFPESADDTVKSHEFIELKEEINGIKVYQFKTDYVGDEVSSAIQKTNTSTKEDKDNGHLGSKDDDLFFTGKYVYSGSNPIPLRKLYPDKLVYHLQLGVFSKKLDHDSFGAVAPIYYEEIENKGLFKYYAGLFFSYKAAGEAHIIIKSRGYPDSFIVAFNEGRQISVEEARQIEYAQIKF